MRLILVRHGETQWNYLKKTQGRSDTLLSSRGVEQAKRIAKRLSNMKIDAVYTSPLKRAKDTAFEICVQSKLMLSIDTALTEFSFGAWEGLTFAQIAERYPEQLKNWNTDPLNCKIPGKSENLEELMERSRRFIEQIRLKHADETIVAVTHSVTGKAIIIDALGLHAAGFLSIHMDNASMSMIDYRDDRTVLRLLNDICHLEEEGKTCRES